MKKNNTVGIILGLLFLIIGGGYLAEVLGFIDDYLIIKNRNNKGLSVNQKFFLQFRSFLEKVDFQKG